MNAPHLPKLSRRRFLGRANCALVSAIPVLNTLVNLRLSGSVAAASASGDYRALVCLFLSGGNDSFNMLAPFSGPSPTSDDAFAEYSASRADLALARDQLIEIAPANTPGRTFGLHGGMPRLAGLFRDGRAAFVANVGTLVEPVLDRSQVFGTTRRLPLGLYSHSDQIEQWQTSVPHSHSGTGWAGRLMDLMRDVNTDPRVSMNISLDGSNVWQSGASGAGYAVSPGNDREPEGGAVALAGYRPDFDPQDPVANAFGAAVDGQLALTYRNLLQQTFADRRRQAAEAQALYSAATAGELPGNVAWPNSPLGRQLRQVARTIMGRDALGACRQTFFVNLGGWDHHSETVALQAAMLPQVDAALGAFWDQLVALGVEDTVTLFSASDFGRTLTSNGRGSDHAWGGNVFALGGGVRGGRIFGDYPGLAINPAAGGPERNPLDTGRGRLIPTTSCDGLFAELALWLGVPRSSLPLVLPNIGNFVSLSGGDPPIGFLA